MEHIALVPRGTGSGHNMRLYAIAQELMKQDNSYEITAFLESLRDVFSQLFNSIGVKTINVSQDNKSDYSKGSILRHELNWDSLMNNFLGPTIFNSQKILMLVRLFTKNNTDLVVSDLDISAIAAAKICNIKSILVTERFELPIAKFKKTDFENAGFKVNETEFIDIHNVAQKTFDWGLDNSTKVVTDCPYVAKLDNNLHFKKLLSQKHAVFVGPIIREKNNNFDKNNIRRKLGIKKDDFLIVAAVGGTTMFSEDKQKMQQSFITTFNNIHQTNPNTKMVLLARDNLKVPKGVICMTYLPNWYGLLKSCDLVLTHPGWITVTELSSLMVPAIFSISSKREYHEWDELIRLSELGYSTDVGCNPKVLTNKIKELIGDPKILSSLTTPYSKVAPWSNGAYRIANIIKKGVENIYERK
ncbi:glycosyltransferase family 28 protein [Oenococcus oeni]|uniref:hypothetical protein n=1 Tax=Oenococcus oeni TaxID=1247 RepID=UPI0010B7A44A|nr:hypothetical protein [Oenococcus oeni]SYW14261.1 conserved hypothetical protein [Oenococcus oeni]